MRRSAFVWFIFLLIGGSLFAQSPQVNIGRGIPYGSAQFPGKKHPQNLCFDFYEPAGESDTLRPLVITLFGGGFMFGSRDWADMQAWCTRFAENGYAAASIDYRVMPAEKISAKGLVRTGYMAAQDLSAAVRFFKANSTKYRIDTNRIFLLGQSAGAVAIIHALYMDEDERPAETFAEPSLPPMHSLGTEAAKKQSFSVAGAILLWGSVYNPEIIDADENTPVCFIHGGKDKILPAESGYAYSITGLPYTYGSKIMADRMKELGFNSYELHLLKKEPHAFYFKYLRMYKLNERKFNICWKYAYDFIQKNSLSPRKHTP